MLSRHLESAAPLAHSTLPSSLPLVVGVSNLNVNAAKIQTKSMAVVTPFTQETLLQDPAWTGPRVQCLPTVTGSQEMNANSYAMMTICVIRMPWILDAAFIEVQSKVLLEMLQVTLVNNALLRTMMLKFVQAQNVLDTEEANLEP